MDGKEASANYDKLGHKLATELKSKKVKCCKSIDIFSTTYLIKNQRNC
jgi:hypothetical protein